MRKVHVDDAIGMTLGHDITKIIPGKEKCRAFSRGHIIVAQDLPRLKDLGKEHIYIWEPNDNLVHEDDAAILLGRAAAGPGVCCNEPNQGRVNLKAKYDGLLKVRSEQLNWINNLDNIIFATLHNNRVVAKNQTVAGTRVIPLAIESYVLDEAERLAALPNPLLTVKPFRSLWVAVVTTGSEVNSGRIKDGFGKVVRQKINPFGGRWMGQTITPDIPELIAEEIQNFIAEGAELILVTGGMSVDADDVTPHGIRASGAEVVFYGAPVLPGSQFMLAYQGHVPVCGVPGGALFSRKTTLDLLLPRIFAGDIINRADIIALGHGGLCEECQICHYPHCSFGKTTYI
ncbi:MAG: molybdopterin-binding protein [Syntrophomonadaceae bacterium]|nr:molybdopterin-binding protein [Syntrophomonadaceae bacterium]MDD3022782.1 molybdopterin-binding protein [Syntrophomonadaceae bacterium]